MSIGNERPARLPWFRGGEYLSKSSGRGYIVGFVGDLKVIGIPDPAATPMKGAVQAWQFFVEAAPNRLPKPASASNARPAGAPGRNSRATTTTTPTTSAGNDDGGAEDADPPW